jgi:hypothetical protein
VPPPLLDPPPLPLLEPPPLPLLEPVDPPHDDAQELVWQVATASAAVSHVEFCEVAHFIRQEVSEHWQAL